MSLSEGASSGSKVNFPLRFTRVGRVSVSNLNATQRGIIANGVVENRILPTARRPYAVHEITLVGVTFELGHFQSQCGKAVCFTARVAALTGCRQKVGGGLAESDGRG